MSGIKDRLIQFILRGKDELSPEAAKAADALESVRAEGEKLTSVLEQAKGAKGLAQAFQLTSAAAERAERDLAVAERRAQDLREALDRSPDSQGLQQSLRVADREAARAAKTFDRLTAETKAAEAAARDAGVDTRNLAGEQDRLTREVDEAQKAVRSNNQQLRELELSQQQAARATKHHSDQAKEKSSTLVTLAKRVAAVAAAYVSYKAVLGLVQKGVGLVSGGIREMLSAGTDAEDALAQLNAALESTGNAAGWSAAQLLEMAQQLRDGSMFSPEQILSAQTRLLSYTDVVGEQFPKAMQIVIDQSQRLGMSVEQSAETVGRALQSPSKAMESLGRQGFKLEAGQKELLQQLEATGRTAEAQAIIMDMLTESYGGSAAAARLNTVRGLWKGLQDQFSDFFGMIADAGAFEYVKEQLTGFAERIRSMAEDGSLKRLAESLSNAFIQGAEKVKEFAARLMEVDIGGFADRASTFFNDFGAHIDDAMTRIQLFIAPFRTLFNGVTSGVALMGAAFTNTVGLMLTVVESVAARIPDILGGPKIRASVQSAREAINALRDGFVEQIEQDGQDIRNAWDTTAKGAVQSNQQISEAAGKAATETADAWDKAVDAAIAESERLRAEVLDAVLAGTRAIADMADALELIDTAKGVQQLEQLKQAMLEAYRTGSLSQEEYANGLNVVNGRLQELTAAQTAAAAAQDKAAAAADQQTKAQEGVAESAAQAARALRDQAAASAEAAGALELEGKKAEKGLASWGGYFARVLTAARTPLAELSSKALATFDALMGINNVDIKPDLSGVEGVRDALKRLREDMFYTSREVQDRFRKSFARWASETVWKSQQIQKATLEQRLELERLMESYESGAVSLQQWVYHANRAKNALTLLDKADLDRLNAAIDGAKQRMNSFGDSARSTLDSLRDELDQLQGNEDAIERRRMERRRRELQMQIAEARAAGDSKAVGQLQQAMSVLSDIERVSQQQKAAGAQATAPGSAGGERSPGWAGAPPTTVVRLQAPGGQAVDVVTKQGDDTALLSILEQSGLRSL